MLLMSNITKWTNVTSIFRQEFFTKYFRASISDYQKTAFTSMRKKRKVSRFRPVWFQLVDSVKYVPYDGADLDAITMPSDSLVFQFRDKVKAKFADSYLKGVPPAALLVYKNITSLMDRNEALMSSQSLMSIGDTNTEEYVLGRTEEDSLVVVVPSHSFESKSQDIDFKLVLDAIQALRGTIMQTVIEPKMSSGSYSHIGAKDLKRLEREDLIEIVQEESTGDAFWSTEDQRNANRIDNEVVFDKFITPYFKEIIESCGLVFINSAKYQWLPLSSNNTKNNLKPDGFATHRSMYNPKRQSDDESGDNGTFHFGVPQRELHDCLILFESKLTITTADYGQLRNYLSCLPLGPTCAILFDRQSFWMIKCHNRVTVKIKKSKWVNKGSKLLLKNFISENKSPWISNLIEACDHFKVKAVQSGFLGRGSFGRVFRVQRGEKIFALKIADERFPERLHREGLALEAAQQTGLTVTLVDKMVDKANGAALLLSPVGTPISTPTTKSEIEMLFKLLYGLHQQGFVHGDPSFQNVIQYENNYLWIDFMTYLPATYPLRKHDATILTRSILLKSPENSLDILIEPINEYAIHCTEEKLISLIDQVSYYFFNGRNI